MIDTDKQLKDLFVAFNTAFKNGFGAPESQYRKISTVVSSKTTSNVYGFLGKSPRFREWIGERQLQNMAAHGYTIVNKKYESTVVVARDDIDDDNIGIYSPLFEELGQGAAEFPDELVFALLKKGISELCYDGQPFFDADHPVFPNVDGTGTPKTVRNYYPDAASGGQWFLMDTTRPIKPMIFQERRAMKLTKMDSDKDQNVFMRDDYIYGVDGRNNAGFGLWQYAACSEESLTAANFDKVRIAMRNVKADGDRRLGCRPNLLIVPPDLLGAAEDIVKVENINGTTNKNHRRVEILECDWLA